MQNTDEIISWLHGWFAKNGAQTDFDVNTPYLESGVIDSLEVIEFIEETEKHFKIQFNETDFQDFRFRTVGGLSELIAAKQTA